MSWPKPHPYGNPKKCQKCGAWLKREHLGNIEIMGFVIPRNSWEWRCPKCRHIPRDINL